MLNQELFSGFMTGWMTFVVGIGLALGLRIYTSKKAKKQIPQISK